MRLSKTQNRYTVEFDEDEMRNYFGGSLAKPVLGFLRFDESIRDPNNPVLEISLYQGKGSRYWQPKISPGPLTVWEARQTVDVRGYNKLADFDAFEVSIDDIQILVDGRRRLKIYLFRYKIPMREGKAGRAKPYQDHADRFFSRKPPPLDLLPEQERLPDINAVQESLERAYQRSGREKTSGEGLIDQLTKAQAAKLPDVEPAPAPKVLKLAPVTSKVVIIDLSTVTRIEDSLTDLRAALDAAHLQVFVVNEGSNELGVRTRSKKEIKDNTPSK